MGACRPQTPAGSERERWSRLRLAPATLLGAVLVAACSPDPSFVDASASTGAGGAAGSGGARRAAIGSTNMASDLLVGIAAAGIAVDARAKAGGTATVIAEGSYLATDVAVDEDAVYFTTRSAAVFKLAK
jgi:hypothetical protein